MVKQPRGMSVVLIIVGTPCMMFGVLYNHIPLTIAGTTLVWCGFQND
jgi:hypothetical protein